MKKNTANSANAKSNFRPEDLRRLLSEINLTFPVDKHGNLLRRVLAIQYALRAVGTDFSKFAPKQIFSIVRSQCFAAAHHLVAADEKLIDRELAKWHLSGKRPGGDRIWMQELSEKSPEVALKILRRYEATVLNREKSKAINREHYLIIDRWINPKERYGSLALWSNDAVASLLEKMLKKEKSKTRAKQSELKSSLGLVSHRPPVFTQLRFSEFPHA